MDQQAFERAKEAYQRKDYSYAALLLSSAKDEAQPSGEALHLLGNALMKVTRFDEAAECYRKALLDSAYKHVGALSCNLGRALLACSRPQEAVSALQGALEDPSYPAPYKAQSILGDAYLALGNVREAGIAFRKASIDEANPNPPAALSKLGNCFMQLDRPVDAIEIFRTALDFSSPAERQNAIYAQLGAAYVAANRLAEGVDAYQKATSDGSFVLSSEDQTRFRAAQNALLTSSDAAPSETDILLQKTGYAPSSTTGSFDPLDPLGKSAEFIPSPDTSSFFEPLTDERIKELERQNKPITKKHRHGVARLFVSLLVVVLIALLVSFAAYWQGYGWPLQENVVSDLFKAQTNHADISSYLAKGTNKEEVARLIPAGATPKIVGIDRSTTHSSARVEATLPQGGTQTYQFDFVRGVPQHTSFPGILLDWRAFIAWKISHVKVMYNSQASGTPVLTQDNKSQTDAAASGAQQSQGAGASADAHKQDTNKKDAQGTSQAQGASQAKEAQKQDSSAQNSTADDSNKQDQGSQGSNNQGSAQQGSSASAQDGSDNSAN